MRRNRSLSPLDGVPVLLKDNIESKDPLATTAGSTALLITLPIEIVRWLRACEHQANYSG